MSEVLRTQAVHVHLHQKPSGAARIVVDVKDGTMRDVVLEAIKAAVEP